jgi:hypothetical protein
VVSHKLPRHLLKLGLPGAALLTIVAIVLGIFVLPVPSAPAAPSHPARSSGSCDTIIDGNVPHAVPITSTEGCKDFKLSVLSQEHITNITVCPQIHEPPLIMGQDYRYEKKQCVTWTAQIGFWHSLFKTAHHPNYPGYVVAFAGAYGDTDYAIKVQIMMS